MIKSLQHRTYIGLLVPISPYIETLERRYDILDLIRVGLPVNYFPQYYEGHKVVVLCCIQYGYRARDYCAAMPDWTEYQHRYITSAHTYVTSYSIKPALNQQFESVVSTISK